MSRRRYSVTALLAVLSMFCYLHISAQADKPKDEAMELYGLFVDAVEQVQANYVRPVSRKELLESALRGMLQDLDPHSNYINTSQWKAFRKKMEGRFGGIGITVGVDPNVNRLKVIAPMAGTPAYEAGVTAGDVIMEIDGVSTEGMSIEKSVELLQGRPGTGVQLQVLHEGTSKPETVKLERAVIDVPSILSDLRKENDQPDFMLDKEKKIGYIRITDFIQNTTDNLKSALEELKEQGAKGLILDVRDNPGGLLSAAVEISDLFLEKGVIVTTKGRNTADKSYEARKEGTFLDIPIAVIVNEYSASASEILAAALQDHKRAVIVGQRSYGKGSVQNIIDLEDGNSVLKLTVAAYWRPSGRNIHRFKNAKESEEWGVSPDKAGEVKLSPAEHYNWAISRRDRDLLTDAHNGKARPKQEASDVKKETPSEDDNPSKEDPEKSRPDRPKTDQAKKRPFSDRQLDKALEIIRGKLAPA